MLNETQIAEPSAINLILFSGDGSCVYLAPGNPPTLPTVRPGKSAQPIKALTTAVKSSYGVDSFLLASFDGRMRQHGESSCAALAIADLPPAGTGLVSIPRHSRVFENLPQDLRSVIGRAVELCNESDPARPFTRFGWTDELLPWLQGQIASLGFGEIEECRHIKGSGRALILRIRTSRQTLWFKAPPRDGYEFDVTLLLSQHCGSWLPKVYATNSDWRGWLMEDAGVSLHEVPAAKHPHEQIVRGLAEIQARTATFVDRLLELGCRDCRLAALERQIDPLTEVLRLCLQDQPAKHARPLTTADMERLQLGLHGACAYLRQFEITDTVLHGDLGDGSILFDGTRTVITDWERAHVGVPLFDFQIYYDYTATNHSENATQVSSLRQEYLAAMEQELGIRKLGEAYRVVPLLTMLSDLCKWTDWTAPDIQPDVEHRRYLRSMARRMIHETQQGEFLEVPCLAHK